MTTLPDLEPAALDAAYAEYKEVIGDIDAGDRLVIRRSIAAYLASRSAPEAGKAVDDVVAERQRQISGLIDSLKWSSIGSSKFKRMSLDRDGIDRVIAALTSLSTRLAEAEQQRDAAIAQLQKTGDVARDLRRKLEALERRFDLELDAYAKDSDMHVLRHRAETAERKLEEHRTDAERWRALMSSQRMHFMGCAGIDLVNKPGTTSRNTADLIPVMKPGEYHHFGMEFWSEHAAAGDPRYPDDFERELITAYADDLRRARALSEREGQE